MYVFKKVFLIHLPKTLQFQLFLERFIPMKRFSPDSNQPSFLLPSFKEQLDPIIPFTSWMRGSTGVWSRRTSRSYTATQVVLRSRSGWWFRFCCWNNLKISVMSKLSDDGLISLLAVFIGRDTLSVETSCSFLRPDPFPQKDRQKRCGTSIEVVDRSLQF